MALNKVEICGVNTAKLPVLTEAEKEALFCKIKQGDREAREQYIRGNLRLVLSVIKRFSGSNENADDLFQIGCIGLMKAIDRFDLQYDVKFSTYAVPVIAGEIKRFLRDDGLVKVSRQLKETAYRAYKTSEVLGKRIGREPSLLEISEEMGIRQEELTFAMEAAAQPESLQKPISKGDGNDIFLGDKIPEQENWCEKTVDRILLEHMLKELEPSERSLIDMRFFKEMTQVQIAKKLHVSQVQVSRLEKKILEKMRNCNE